MSLKDTRSFFVPGTSRDRAKNMGPPNRWVLRGIKWVSSHKAVALSLWVMNPLGVKGHFYRGHLRSPENTDIYIVVHNHITVME